MSSHRTLENIVAAMTALIHEVHALGGAQTRERIMQAASEGMPSVRQAIPISAAASNRVAPGTIRPTVRRVLETEEGLSTAEVGRRVTEADPRVSRTSVANELQRNRGKLYQRKRGRWFLLPQEEEQRQTAGIVGDDPPPLLNGTTG